MVIKKSEKDLKAFKKEFIDNIEKERMDFDEDEEDREDIYPISFGFGTNEDIEVDSRKELESNLTFKKITEEEYKVIKKVLGEDFGLSAII
ncbi:MAG TPA: hypothetical protein VLE44_02350 [Candidatus Saccharimonadales bacterium]|nr:hypothetical protein [Candidatus Saccharimonadales bacterium]